MGVLVCAEPDRDEPKLICGYPIPCPWHRTDIAMPKRARRKLKVPKTTSAQARALSRTKSKIASVQKKFDEVRRELSELKQYRTALAKKLTS